MIYFFSRSILTFFFVVVSSLSYAQPVRQITPPVYSNDPRTVFENPPESAKPGVLWMWMGCNLSKEGITKDLEALKKEGFNRTTMFSLADVTTPWAGKIGKSPTPEIISWTEPWWKMVRHAAEESKRLGMDFGMFNGPAYEASGGRWITPELSMQELCWSQTKVVNGRVRMFIPRPEVPLRGHTPYPIFNGETGKVEIPEIAARKTYYKDIAVVALPATGPVSTKEVIDLSSRMLPGDSLYWTAPAGDWVIYRFGHTTSGTLIQPAQWEATGLECDKMSVEAVSFHMDHVIGEIQKHLGDLIGTGFTHVHFDSYEAGDPTWTPKMSQEFLSRRGYDLTSFLPTFAGRTVGTVEDSIKFRSDFTATIKDLYRDVYFTIISKKLQAANLTFLCEPYGGPWRQEEVMPLVQKVMTEFWTNKGVYFPYELRETVAALRLSGQNIIEAEAFTGDPSVSQWDETPAWLKPIGDAAFCDGVNRLVLHRFVQQAFDDRYKPGATMGRWGTHFDRTQTWWEPAKALVKYWQRCQALLQWGAFVTQSDNHSIASDIHGNITIKNIRRHQDSTDIYFVANTSRKAGDALCSFKVSGRMPEIWDPVTGTIAAAPVYTESDGKISFRVRFDKAQSFFVVFRNRISAKKETKKPALTVLARIDQQIGGPWRVQFDSAWGGPAAPVTFPVLEDWTKNPASGIKYFSGTAVYTRTFSCSPSTVQTKTTLAIDLGVVNHLAKVSLNDMDLGVVWTAPWKIKIPTGVLKKTGNRLVIAVTNVWANRLIGDEQEPADCEWIPGYISGGYSLKEFPDWFLQKKPRPSKGRYCFTTWNYFDKNSPLVSSGLLGPVRIISE